VKEKTMSAYKELIVWQKAMNLTEEIYRITKYLPPEELYGITSQIRRSVISIPSNIAEGSRRGGRKEYSHFIKIALGSTAEVETQLLLIQKLYNPKGVDIAIENLIEIQKMLSGLSKKLNA